MPRTAPFQVEPGDSTGIELVRAEACGLHGRLCTVTVDQACTLSWKVSGIEYKWTTTTGEDAFLVVFPPGAELVCTVGPGGTATKGLVAPEVR